MTFDLVVFLLLLYGFEIFKCLFFHPVTLAADGIRCLYFRVIPSVSFRQFIPQLVLVNDTCKFMTVRLHGFTDTLFINYTRSAVFFFFAVHIVVREILIFTWKKNGFLDRRISKCRHS